MAYTIIRPEDHDGWLKAREKGIGSSEVATILGRNPYQTKLELYNRKMGLTPPIEENEAMLMGHLVEPIVAYRFEKATGNPIITDSEGDWLAVDNEEPYLRCSPDRLFYIKGAEQIPENVCILECKTTQLDVDADNPPFYWVLQLQYQMGIMGIRQGALGWIVRGVSFGYKKYKFDDKLFELEKQAIRDFIHNNLDTQTPPQPENINDIKALYPKSYIGKTISGKELVVINPEEEEAYHRKVSIAEALREYKAINDKVSELTSKKNQIAEIIQTAMLDAEAVTMDVNGAPKILATWKTAKDSCKFNSKKFEKEHPEEVKPYMEMVQGSRRFLVK